MFSLELSMDQFAELCTNIIFPHFCFVCIDPVLGFRLQIRRNSAKVSSHALIAEGKTWLYYRLLRVFYLKILITSNLCVPWHMVQQKMFSTCPVFYHL